MSALAPAILRVGGSAANFVTYDPDDIPTSGERGHSAGGQETRGQGGAATQDVAEEGFKRRCYDEQFATPTFTNFTITRELTLNNIE